MVNTGNSYLLKLTKDVSFLNKATLRNAFHKIPSNSQVVIDGSQSHFVDNDIKDTIEDFIEASRGKSIQVELKHLEL